MLHRIRRLLFIAFTLSAQAEPKPEPITMHGSALLAQVMKAAEPFLKEELGIEVRVGTEGGATGGFLSVGSGTAQLGLTTKLLDAADRAQFPARSFDEAQIGWQVLGIGVANDVWAGGVHSLTRNQMVKIYEGDIRNWKEVGGPNEAIKFYNP